MGLDLVKRLQTVSTSPPKLRIFTMGLDLVFAWPDGRHHSSIRGRWFWDNECAATRHPLCCVATTPAEVAELYGVLRAYRDAFTWQQPALPTGEDAAWVPSALLTKLQAECDKGVEALDATVNGLVADIRGILQYDEDERHEAWCQFEVAWEETCGYRDSKGEYCEAFRLDCILDVMGAAVRDGCSMRWSY